MLSVKETKPFNLSPEKLEEMKTIIKRYPAGRHKSALIPMLHIAQAENGGWLSVEAMDKVAEILNIKPIEAYEVASFYSMFNLNPVGKVVLDVCRTTPCMLRGSDEIISYIEKKLGITNGETTKDGMFTLKTVECLGSCGGGPMMQCGASYHENLTTEKVDALLEKYKNADRNRNYTDLDYEVTL